MKNIFYFLLIFFLASCARKTGVQMSESRALLNHAAFYVVDLKISTAFYRNIIGLDTIPEPFHDNRHTWFQVDTHSHLHLIQGATAKSPHDKNTHLCFSVKNIATITSLLNAGGYPYENWAGEKNTMTTRVDGIHQIYFQDPDGYWIEINDDRK
ncbi:MAG TPA: VOC family protein [Flavitalea sp.]|nr:VOC family protein [Flavitalea sp.]